MLAATSFLVAIGLLGSFDIVYFHAWRAKLVLRPESRREGWIHVARGFCYAVQFALVPHVELHGRWWAAWGALFAIDAGIALADVLEEPRSRASQGGLSRGEYLMHIALSVGVGGLLHAVFSATWGDWRLPSGVHFHSELPASLQRLTWLMAAGSAAVASAEALVLIEVAAGSPVPVHVRVRLLATLEQVWNTTQDHRLHPSWDHRFSRIELCHEGGVEGRFDGPLGTPDPRIQTGTTMRYAKRLLGFELTGFGRYRLHLPLRQSTFEFGSEDPWSLIRRGRGLWRYEAIPGGHVEFSTSYTYEVRWGIMGRIIDRLVFRPLFQRVTEQSFRRLAKAHFPRSDLRVMGRAGRGPARFPTGLPS